MTQYLVTITGHGSTLIYADGPEEAAAQYASRLPKKPTAQLRDISDYAGERLYFFKAGRIAFSIRRSYEGD